MSESSDAPHSTEILSDASVMSFLQGQPEFFNKYPELLQELRIPHQSGDAISLVEKQLVSLREENKRLKTTQDIMIKNARANEALIKRIHDLVLQLMEATGPRAIFSTLCDQLKQHFNADRVGVLVFAELGFVEEQGLQEFVGKDDPRKALFSGLLEEQSPSCGRVSAPIKEALWPEQEELSGSAAMLPLSTGTWSGVIAIQSDDDGRFTADMGTEFLGYISDIVCLVADPWVARN
ncbi:MAG: DUF484 family protein [Pseudomonadota bacterium]